MNRRLILIRHGETVWNAERRFTTRTDVPLNDAGLARRAPPPRRWPAPASTASTARRWAGACTAETIARRHPVLGEVTADARLTEIDAGPFEGQTEEELQAGPLAGEFARWHTDGDPEFPAGSEPFDAALDRASAFLAEHDGEPGTTLVVTHGSLARLIVSSHFLGGPPPLHRRLWLDNCRLAVFEWRGGVPKLIAFNAERRNRDRAYPDDGRRPVLPWDPGKKGGGLMATSWMQTSGQPPRRTSGRAPTATSRCSSRRSALAGADIARSAQDGWRATRTSSRPSGQPASMPRARCGW